ncbi:AAA family ATPase [Agromyces albus]|nr:AAA family ATPase [Agromyces albus]
MTETASLRLRSASVLGVLGEYDHEIEFQDGSNFVIVYGPNGIGKTKLLEIIDALLRMNFAMLSGKPFSTARLEFEDGSALSAAVSRIHGPAPAEERDSDFEGSLKSMREHGQVTIRLERPDGSHIDWTWRGEDQNNFELYLQRETTWIPINGGAWQDQTDGEIADLDELSMRFGWRDVRTNRKQNRPPADFVAFADRLTTHLIETQRLKIEEYMDRSPRSRNSPRNRRGQTTIVDYASKMRELLSKALAENSRVTQQLDRTFPSRVLSRDDASEVLDEVGIREKYESQNRFRSRLADIALIGLEPELALPERTLTIWEVSMLDLYLADADNKLQSFENLLEKIEALEEIINARLLRKHFAVNAHDGLVVTHTSDGRPISLDSLSSGEQHEIILMFDLLFNVEAGSLVMIDEPEISLHVSWQVDFIADVERIASLADFQFIVATHSPQIINTWWSRAKQLGPHNEEFFGPVARDAL